jgi:excisionase family DNA binding protein
VTTSSGEGGAAESTTAQLVIRSPDFEHLPAVLTTREAAQALRIGVKEMRSLVDEGHVPAARFGPRRVIRIAKSALLSILGRRRSRET